MAAQLKLILEKSFCEKRSRNSRFSLRSFARQLSIAPSTLSEILNGKRKLSPKMALKICKKLSLSQEETDNILQFLRNKDFQKSREMLLNLDQFQLIADVYHFAVFELIKSDGYRGNLKEISEYLDIPHLQVQEIVARLQRLELISFDPETKKVMPIKGAVSSPDEVPSKAIRDFHRSTLQKAIHALDEVPLEQRDYHGLTVAIDPKKISGLKKMIRQFNSEVIHYLDSGNKSELIQLNMCLFPLGRKGNL